MTDTKRTPEIEEAILHAMSCGITLTDACKDAGIHYVTWRNWCRADAALDIAHAQARDQGYDVIADDCLRIADDGRNDYIDGLAAEGDDVAERARANGEHIQRSKLRVDTRLKLLAKWDPRRYGDKMDLNHGGQKDNPINVLLAEMTGETFNPVTDED